MQKGGAGLHHQPLSTFWDRWARFYDCTQWSNRRVNAAAAARTAALVPTGARVLDCAAGTGLFSLAAAERAASVLCTDLSEAMLEQAERKARRRGLTNLRFARRDLTALPDPEGSFDAVIAANVLHLLPAPEQAVREFWRVAAPGGSSCPPISREKRERSLKSIRAWAFITSTPSPRRPIGPFWSA